MPHRRTAPDRQPARHSLSRAHNTEGGRIFTGPERPLARDAELDGGTTQLDVDAHALPLGKELGALTPDYVGLGDVGGDGGGGRGKGRVRSCGLGGSWHRLRRAVDDGARLVAPRGAGEGGRRDRESGEHIDRHVLALVTTAPDGDLG